jgi:ribosomal protein S18 acetylase RimI-like enzyme
VDVSELPPDRFFEASVVLADAYLDDPGWVAVGPDNPKRRHAYTRRICRGSLNIVERWGGTIWHVQRDGRVAGVLTSCDPGQWPPPEVRATLMAALGPVLAGPTVLWRSLVADNAMHKHHPPDPHFYVWMLAVSPKHQRTGIGRALLNTALERADGFDTFTYLETAKPENLPYYSSFGFRETGVTTLPRNAPIWFMMR